MTGFSAIPIADESGSHDHARWAGVARVAGPRWARMPSLTIGLLGVQVLWSVEMSYASPYLLSLGLSKSLMAVVFLAGPLSGLIVQPMIGILADNSKSRFGRRRPFIIVATALCGFATLLLGFTRPFASIFTSPDSLSNDILTVWLAILAIYCIDFSINAVQALDRALLVDTLPTGEQPTGNAWAARMLAIGSVAGFFVGNLDLPQFFPFFGSAQLEVLSVIAALLLFTTNIWVCTHVKERVLLSSSNGPKGLKQELKELWETLVRLPSVIRQICLIQFFAWLGWFPVLFYTTVYIGDLHKNSSPIPEDDDAAIALDAQATRLGTRALFYSALVSLVANIVMPSFIVPQHAGHAANRPLQPKQKTWLERVRMHLATLWATSHFIFASCMAATFVTSSVSGATFIMSVTGFCWAITQWAPFALLAEAILSHPNSDGDDDDDVGTIHLADTRSTRGGHIRDDVERDADADVDERERLFQADFDEEGDEEGNEERSYGRAHVRSGSGSRDSFSRPLSFEHDQAQEDHHEHERGHEHEQHHGRDHDHDHDHDSRPRIIGMGSSRARVSRIDIDTPSSPSMSRLDGNEMMSQMTTMMVTSSSGSTSKSTNGLSAQAGAILGIHNMFIVIPQFLVTGLSSIIFAIFDPDKSVLHGHHPGNMQPGNGTITPGGTISSASQDGARELFRRAEELSQAKPDSIAIIFRLGGIAAAIAFVLSYRLAKELKRH